jgi:hypothetical protein
MSREALWHDHRGKERPQEIEWPECVPVVHEEDERVGFGRIELHRAHAAAEGILERVCQPAQHLDLRQHDKRQALPRRPHGQASVALDANGRPRSEGEQSGG